MVASLLLLALLEPAAASAVEGRTIRAVRLELPAEQAARLARFVELVPGEPLRAAAVRHAVALLFATGEFEDVVVESRPSGEGVEVVFRPRPAPLLERIRVEGDPLLTPGALRRITRLKDGEPLWPPRLERAARDAALSLADAGYLEARVSAEVGRGEGGAEAVFLVQGGPLVRVGAASVEGLEAGWARRLARLIEPRPGQVFGRARARHAAEKMRQSLVAEGRWRADVEARESYDPERTRLGLVFHVTPGPLVSVEFRGARPPTSVRRSVERLLRDGALRGDVLEEATDRLEDDYRRRGHREAAASHTEEARPQGRAIVFTIAPGPRATVGSVRVVGAGPAALQGVATLRPGAPLEERLVEADARALGRALEEDGYAEARVETDLREGGGALPVTYRVRPGSRTLVRSLEVRTPTPLPPKTLVRETRLKVGGPYRVADLARDRSDLLAGYRNAGYLQAEVTPEVVLSGDRSEASVTVRVSPGPRTEIDHIVISGLERTKEVVVRRELRISEGRPLALQEVLESQRRLGSLGIFQSVNLSEMDPESVERRSVVVSLEEAPRTTVAYGIGYAERELLRGSAEVTRRNLGGLDRSVSTFARASFRGNRFLTTYREPYLFGRKQELFVTGFREEDDRDSFDFVRFGGFLQTARALSPQWSLILRYTYQETSVFNIEVPLDELDRQFRSSTFSGPSASLVKDSRDDPLDPRRGHFVGADAQLSHTALGGDSFGKAFLQVASYRRLTSRALIATNLRIGLARTFRGEPARLPLPDRFFAGGDYSLRGFKVDTAGPLERSTSGVLVPTGGNALLLGGAELRYDVGRFVSLAAFAEAGNVYPLVSEIRLDDLRYTAGAGIRYKSAFGPLRVDWGYKLNRRPDESPSRFHVTIGHAF